MSDLILRARLSLLRKNLDDVRRTPLSIITVEPDVRELLDLLVKSSPLRESLITLLEHANEANVALLKGDTDSAARKIDLIASGVRAHLSQLDGVEKGAVQSIRRRSIAMREEGLGSRLQDPLATCAETEIAKVNAIARALLEDTSTNGDAKQCVDQALAVRHRAWSSYRERSGRSNELFSEYVDLLGGLALRDAGFDGGICRLADKILRQAGRFADLNWSLVIPAREEAANVTLARIIRVGFPEWTIWALPVAAHEFGHLVVTRLEGLQQFMAREAVGDEAHDHLRVCLADAFATLMMGPAYACAAVLLRLDPETAFSQETCSLTARRAEVILRTLQRDGTYSKIREQLAFAWTEALEHTGTSGSLDDETLDQVETLISEVVRSIGPGRALPAIAWERITQFGEALATGRVAELPLAFGDDDVRYILNAAWLCRLEADDPEDTDGVRIEQIAKNTIALWRRIETPQAAVMTSPSQPPHGFGGGAQK